MPYSCALCTPMRSELDLWPLSVVPTWFRWSRLNQVSGNWEAFLCTLSFFFSGNPGYVALYESLVYAQTLPIPSFFVGEVSGLFLIIFILLYLSVVRIKAKWENSRSSSEGRLKLLSSPLPHWSFSWCPHPLPVIITVFFLLKIPGCLTI